MKKALKVILFLFVLILIIWFLGPRPDKVVLPTALPEVSSDLRALEASIDDKESQLQLRPNNAAEIIWADTPYQKTEYSLVYLHGFSASHFEGDPINRLIAEKYGMNLYLSRLEGHGLKTDNALLDLNVGTWLESALEAIAIGHKIGEKTIVMSCSTGSTMAIYANEIDRDIFAHLMYSPNIDIYDPLSKVLTMPYGLQIARLVQNGKYNCWEANPDTKDYWYSCQRLEGVVALRQLVDVTMTHDAFKAFDKPLFIGCYYKNDSLQDQTVSVKAIDQFYSAVETPKAQKELIKFPEASDHVIVNSTRNPNWENVLHESEQFIEDVLKISPKEDDIIN